MRRYLALAVGRLGSPRAVPALLAAAKGSGGASPDSETQIYAVWALGAIADPAAVPFRGLARAPQDAGIRKAAVHALGSFPDDASAAALAPALSDPIEDVRWNAAVALARRRDPRAAPVLLQMMDRAPAVHPGPHAGAEGGRDPAGGGGRGVRARSRAAKGAAGPRRRGYRPPGEGGRAPRAGGAALTASAAANVE